VGAADVKMAAGRSGAPASRRLGVCPEYIILLVPACQFQQTELQQQQQQQRSRRHDNTTAAQAR
jgi:hypothetical protein